MKSLTQWYSCLTVLSVCVPPVKLYDTTEWYGTDRNKNGTFWREPVKYKDAVGDVTTPSEMIMKCETPNNENGYCIRIQQCDTILKQIANGKRRRFLSKYKCGSRNDDPKNPRICCPEHNNSATKSDDSPKQSKKKPHSVLPKSCGQQKTILADRIVGGTEAALGEYPWMARLMHKKYTRRIFGCSGFLVARNYVVTAAHCTHSNTIAAKGAIDAVVLGEHNTDTAKDCSPDGVTCATPRQVSRIIKVTTHPGYDPDNNAHYNDIAIIQLKKGMRLSQFVQPICLTRNATQIPNTYHLSGWGATKTGPRSKIKMSVEVPPFDRVECTEKYSTIGIQLNDTQICAGGVKGKDSCSGDSGGPLMMYDDNGSWYATGIVSFGLGCGREGWPGVYTKIEKYLPWIESQIREGNKNRKKKTKRQKIKTRG